MKTAFFTAIAVISVSACSSNVAPEVRNGPQTQSPSGGAAAVMTDGAATPVIIVEEPTQPAAVAGSGNEYNRNAGIYAASFQGALAVSQAR